MRYFVGTNDMLVGLLVPTNFQMYRQNSEKALLGGGGGSCPPAPPLATLMCVGNDARRKKEEETKASLERNKEGKEKQR